MQLERLGISLKLLIVQLVPSFKQDSPQDAPGEGEWPVTAQTPTFNLVDWIQDKGGINACKKMLTSLDS